MVWISGEALDVVSGTWASIDLLAVVWISGEATDVSRWAWTGIGHEVDQEILLLLLAVLWVSGIALEGASWTWAGLFWGHEAVLRIRLEADGITSWARTVLVGIEVHQVLVAVLWVGGVAVVITDWTWAAAEPRLNSWAGTCSTSEPGSDARASRPCVS